MTKIATVLSVHGDTDTVLDTLDSIRMWATEDVLVVVDGSAWNWGKDLKVPAYKMEGLLHGSGSSPYRNVALGLSRAIDLWPDVDWYSYVEYDVLFTSDEFKKDLENAGEDAWCLGNDLRIQDRKFPLLEKIARRELKEAKYLLGCCMFYKAEFMHLLKEMDFFNRLLWYTNPFQGGFFPCETDIHDIGEYIYPTVAHSLGGRVGQFAVWNESKKEWKGAYERYPMRWQPELDQIESFSNASIMHPLKEYSHPTRHLQRIKRNVKRI